MPFDSRSGHPEQRRGVQPPTLQDILAARARVYAHMRPSPLLKHPLLDEWIGRPTWIKHENHNPTGSFKVRGGLNLVAQLSEEEKQRKRRKRLSLILDFLGFGEGSSKP